MKIVKNVSLSEIYIKEVGIPIPAESQYEIPPQEYALWHAAVLVVGSTLVTKIDSEDLVINDGVGDLIATDGKNYLKTSYTAFNQRFLSEPERSNGFVSKNTQEAIEEAKAAIEGKVSVLPTFLNNGLTRNKWLALDGAMAQSDELPTITSFDSRLASITFINSNDNADTDLEFYTNGVWQYTWEIRNKRYAWKTSGLSGVVFTRGDRISVYAREASGTGVNPSSVIVFVNVQTTNSAQGEGGGVTL